MICADIPSAEKSWEGFVIESLLLAAGDQVQAYFYPTQAGAELDLVLEFAPAIVGQ